MAEIETENGTPHGLLPELNATGERSPLAEQARLDLLIFSKDRACQLDGLLRSIRAFLRIPHRIHVLYTTSSEDFERGYDLLRRWHPGVDWVDQGTTFGIYLRDLVARIAAGPSRFLMLLVDDMLFTRSFTAEPLMAELERDEDILAVSLRLGETIDFCYPRNIPTRPPDFSQGYRWAWKTASPGYWNYPMSTDGNVYRTRDLANYLPGLRFENPSTLEAAMAQRPLPQPLLTCEPTPCVVNLAVNVVQSTFPNRHGEVTAESLNRAFLAGFALDPRPFLGRTFSSCHVEAELRLIWDPRRRQPPPSPVGEGTNADRRCIDLRKIPCFVINLEEHGEKRKRMERQLRQLGLDYEIVRGIRADPSWVGVALSHLKVLRLSRAEPPFLVLEDDCELNKHFEPLLEVPDEAHALYLGVSAFGLKEPGRRGWGVYRATQWEQYDHEYLRVHNMLARHAVLYLSSRFQEAAIASQVEALTNRSFPHPGDVGLAMLQASHIVITPKQLVCRQRERDATAIPLQDLVPGARRRGDLAENGPAEQEPMPRRPAPPTATTERAELEIALTDGDRHYVSLPVGSPEMKELLAAWSDACSSKSTPRLLQLPHDDGRSALSFSSRDLVSVNRTKREEAAREESGQSGSDYPSAPTDPGQWLSEALGAWRVLDLDRIAHDYRSGPWVPSQTFDLVLCHCASERVDSRTSHHLLATLASSRTAIVLGLPPEDERAWQDRLGGLGFRLDEALTAEIRSRETKGRSGERGHVFVRHDGLTKPRGPSTSPRGNPPSSAPSPAVHAKTIDPLPIHDMEVARKGNDRFYLFLDIFVHPSRTKIVAVAPHYGADWDAESHGVDFERIEMVVGGGRIRGRYIPHRLDSFEPCVLFDFEDSALEALLQEHRQVSFKIAVGTHEKDFTLSTLPTPAYEVAMSLVVKDENRWVRTFLEYYLRCLEVDHVFVYDNGTADQETLLEILAPYREAGEVTYIPWSYRWRNRIGPRCAMIGQPPQQAHSLNRFANCRWVGFFDTDELLRIPGRTLPQFLSDYEAAQIDGLSLGLRWFRPLGPGSLDEVSDPPLSFRHSYRDNYGRKSQKLIVAPRDVRFLRLHRLEEGKRELAVDDTDIFVHHYVLRSFRFEEGAPVATRYDDHMMRFRDRLAGLSPAERTVPATAPLIGTRVPARPENAEAWILHILSAFEAAENGRSRLSEEALSVDGLCGTMNRHFLNRLCGFEGCRYLEIGTLHGASTCAALGGNDVRALCIENWSRFGGSRETFEENLRRHAPSSSVRLTEADCFTIDSSGLGPCDIYFYDGDHSAASQYRAITHFVPALAPLAVIVIDDWNWERVRDATHRALLDLETERRLEVLFSHETLLRDDDVAHMPHHRGRETWWNGIGVFLVEVPA